MNIFKFLTLPFARRPEPVERPIEVVLPEVPSVRTVRVEFVDVLALKRECKLQEERFRQARELLVQKLKAEVWTQFLLEVAELRNKEPRKPLQDQAKPRKQRRAKR